MKLWWLLTCVAALYPVTDFRVKDMANCVDKSHAKFRAVSAMLSLRSIRDTGIINTDTTSSCSESNSGAQVLANSLIVPLHTDKYRSIYWADLTVSQNSTNYNETFAMLLDTGSAIAWIANSACSLPACMHIRRFSAPTVTPTEFYLDYSTGKISGLLVDQIKSNITYTLAHQISASNFSCGLAASVPSFFSNYSVSGIFGLSANASTERGTNFLLLLGAEKSLSSTKFGLILGPPEGTSISNTFSNSLVGGLLLLGQMADSYASSLAVFSVKSKPVIPNISGYWMVALTLVSAATTGGQNSSFKGASAAVFDTGTTGLALPVADADTIHQLLFGTLYVTNGQGSYAFPCNATGSMTFDFDGLNLSMPVDLIRADEYTSAGLLGMCSSKIQGLASSSNWILGAAFLQNFYTVFDIDNQSIGFAPRVILYSYNSSISSGPDQVDSACSSGTTTARWNDSESSSEKALSPTSSARVGSANIQVVGSWKLILFLMSSLITI